MHWISTQCYVGRVWMQQCLGMNLAVSVSNSAKAMLFVDFEGTTNQTILVTVVTRSHNLHLCSA